MSFSMSGVSDGYSYNRFDLYEKKEEDKKKSSKKSSCKECGDDKDCKCDDKKKSSGGGARWQDSDGDGKWYEPGEDVAVSEEVEGVEEGYKELPKHKMQDKAAMKPDTARGEKQARKLDTVRKATKMFPDEVKAMVKGREMDNKKKGLERRFGAPSADGAETKKMKNKAYKLENQRRQDLNKRYGPKKEEIEYLVNKGFAESLEDAEIILNSCSEEFRNHIEEQVSVNEAAPLAAAIPAVAKVGGAIAKGVGAAAKTTAGKAAMTSAASTAGSNVADRLTKKEEIDLSDEKYSIFSEEELQNLFGE